MLTEKNFPDALKAMNFTERGNVYEKIFAEGVVMTADLSTRKLSYPAQIKGRDRNNFFDAEHKENLVVFECVNRLLDKGYSPEDIWLEKAWSLGHSAKSGRADICVSADDKVLFIIECKTAGAEYKRELANMQRDGGQLFSYWQQEQSCQWLVLYASTFDGNDVKFSAASVPCDKKFYRDAHTVPERFRIWSERYDKKFLGDVIFHDETRAYKIGVKPLRKRDLQDFGKLESVVNRFEEILRHNPVSNKANAFDVLIALFICKLADESQTAADAEVSFQFKDDSDTHETFQDRLQRLYRDGMEKFLKEKIDYVPLSRVDDLLRQINQITREELAAAIKHDYRRLKFFSPNVFAFINVYNENLFYMNAKILIEVVNMLQNYFIIGSKDLQTLGTLFEQLLDKGFKQDEGQFFTPAPIAQFIWDGLPLDDIIADVPPKIIDYACGAAHFLTEGYKAVNDCFARKNLSPPVLWERDKLFGVEKDPRLATVSKISFFMNGANEGNIKFGDGLENYPDENISPESFDILVANPPYSVKGFKAHLKLNNDAFEVLDKISVSGSEIETLFAERIAQLVKPRGVAAVILPSSILNKDGKSFVAAREALLKNFYVRAIVQLGSKTFGATSTNTVIFFLQRIFDPPERANLVKDSANIILRGTVQIGDEEAEIFPAYLARIGVKLDDYKKFLDRAVDFDNRQIPYFAAYADRFTPAAYKNLSDDEQRRRNNQKFFDAVIDIERQKIIFFALTYRQRTLIITAPDDLKAQEIFLGYGWSNAKGREGIVEKKRGGLLFDNQNRAAENTLAAVVRAIFRGEELHLPDLEKFYHFATLADLLDFDAADFTKTIRTTPQRNIEAKPGMTLYKLGAADFAVSIGNRVLSTEIVDDGEVPVYSANVFEEFGRINKRNITDFSKPSVIWGIDGDWMVNFIPANVPFYPTDHCGVLRVNTDKIIAEYLAFVLRVEGEFAKFSRANRASIQRIKSLRVQIPPLDVQKKIVAEFNALDEQIAAQDEMICRLDADIQAKFTALFDGKNFPRERLGTVAPFASERTTLDKIQIADFVTTDNMLKDKHGIEIYDAEPQISALTKFFKGDVLISNIRPYLKKIWLADRAGGCSPDVLVFRSRDEKILSPEYLFAVLSQDKFFEFMISTAKGMKMPRGDKDTIKKFELELPPRDLQEKFATYVATCETLKKSARARREKLIRERAELVTKYFR